ncbi:MAG: SDR family NAD(P)-dependent oxidoreductase, partial [Bacteroidia bacterium]
MQPMLREDALQGKVIVVTGGGSGLGKSMSEYFLKLGAKVVICGRDQERLDAACAELREKAGGEVIGIPCDVRHYDQVENVLTQGIAHFGEVNVLVNNAAGNFISPTERLSHRAFDAVVDIVLRGSYNTTLAFGKYWIANKIKGTALNIVTTYAWTGT